MTESPEDRLARANMIFNEKMKALASYNSNAAILFYSGAIVTVPLGMAATILSPDLQERKAYTFIGLSIFLCVFFLFMGRKSLNAAMKNLEDLKLPPTDSAR
ncbi:hypothetical protein [Roseomonas haemaphysalidis]|uniref:Uncharacterized protein n=1 Tax=Roseomonas haemaphysalidis TaxID=2768162 RepID=A0ABS3KWJ7_9PROT|nr:hypothetical protein [Roseomonas haemaphysalidis]MBO1081847.1 hypothetical protein [Roseomonas haemaphysalidis]